MGELKDMSQLGMVLALIAQGFTPARDGVWATWLLDGADEFCERMLLKGAKMYVLAWPRRHETLERGAQYITHDGPDAYFRALSTLTDVTGAQALRGEGRVLGAVG